MSLRPVAPVETDSDRKLEIVTSQLVSRCADAGLPPGNVTLKWYPQEQRFHVRLRIGEHLSEFWPPIGIYLTDPPGWIVEKITQTFDWRSFLEKELSDN